MSKDQNFMFIERVQIEEGFLDGLDLRFCEGLNTIIGERGTGKTSLVELIRFCLDIRGYSSDVAKRSRDHALSVLGSGQITVTLTDGQRRIVVSRTANDTQPRASGPFRSPIVFSQTEIESVGLQPTSRLQLIDSFAPRNNFVVASMLRAGKAMTGYRCYLLDEESRIFERQDFEADSDAEAIAIARTFAWEHKPRRFEVWEGTRYFHGEDCAPKIQGKAGRGGRNRALAIKNKGKGRLPKHILIVDDDAGVRTVLCDMWKTLATKSASSLTAPKCWFVANDKSVDAIVLDLLMPGENSADLALHAKSLKLPVIVATGSNEEIPFVEEYHLPLLRKPFGYSELIEALEKILTSGVAGHHR